MIGPHNLAPHACLPEESRGRRYPEPESKTRTCFQRDRDRIIHSSAFRRLQYKTQVFVNHEGDFFRTRLTHSIEVAQVARSVCRALSLNEDMAEALALAHDLGHPPFGHAGEDALKEAMEPYGGFDHNAQSLRLVAALEHRYMEFDGLNLTWETLEGVVKHNGPMVGAEIVKPLPWGVPQYIAVHDLELDTFAGPEAQVASLSDDIAYNNHDIEDGLRAGLFTVKDLDDVPLVGPMFRAIRKDHPKIDEELLIHEAVRGLIGAMVEDLLAETKSRLADANPRTADDIRRLATPVTAFSEVMQANDKALKAFLFENMYRHYKLNRMTSKARRTVTDLFNLLIAEPDCLPTDVRMKTDGAYSETTARLVADYIAGMTDRFALDEHRQLFDTQARSS